MRYLIIDDDSVFAATLARAFERRGHDAATAENLSEALHWLAEFQPDRIVLDLKLGSESGLSVLRKLLDQKQDAQILMLTAYSSIPTAVEAIKLGARNYLCKPASAQEIIAAFDNRTPDEAIPLQKQPTSVNRVEWEHIQRVLQQHDGNVSATARALGMHRRTLQRKLQKRPVKH